MRHRKLLAAAINFVAALQTPSKAASITVAELRGDVNDATYGQFEHFVGDHLDKVIGLKIGVEAIGEKTFSAYASDGQFVAYKRENAQSEIVANSGFNWQHGAYLFDGFFHSEVWENAPGRAVLRP